MSKSKIKKEVEFKWSILKPKEFDLFLSVVKKMRLSIRASHHHVITDYYIVTQNEVLPSAPRRTRIRKIGKTWYLTQKTISRLKRGFVQRAEENKRLPKFKNIRSTIKYVRRFFPNSANLRVYFVIKNQRKTYLLKDRSLLAEISFDKVRIYGKNKIIKMMEIELELMRGSLGNFRNLTRRITRFTGLPPAKRSKVATALSGLHLGRIN